MSEWWTYSLSDFLLFSARTYYRLFELYNREIWPAQIVAIALGFVILVCTLRAGERHGKTVALILATSWLWVAWAFHIERYSSINWAAPTFAGGFVAQSLLLAWIGIARNRLQFHPVHPRQRAGLGLFLFALLVQPLIGPLLGRPWLQAEIFGVAPDPTVMATLGILLAVDRPPWILFPIPLLWCAITGATLWTMGSADAWQMPLLGLLALGLAMRNRLQ